MPAKGRVAVERRDFLKSICKKQLSVSDAKSKSKTIFGFARILFKWIFAAMYNWDLLPTPRLAFSEHLDFCRLIYSCQNIFSPLAVNALG